MNHKQYKASTSLDARFLEFHAENPDVLTWLCDEALYLQSAGYKRGSMKMLIERLRWMRYIETKGDIFKINNSYASYYARLAIAVCPTLKGFFETRTQDRSLVIPVSVVDEARQRGIGYVQERRA